MNADGDERSAKGFAPHVAQANLGQYRVEMDSHLVRGSLLGRVASSRVWSCSQGADIILKTDLVAPQGERYVVCSIL